MTLKHGSRFPDIQPIAVAAPQRFVKKVICNHYRTQDMLSQRSREAGHVCNRSTETVLKANETIRQWKQAQSHL